MQTIQGSELEKMTHKEIFPMQRGHTALNLKRPLNFMNYSTVEYDLINGQSQQ